MIGQKKIYKAKKRKLECINTHQSCLNSQKAKIPLVDLSQASRISLERDSTSNVGPFYILFAQVSPLTPKQKVTSAQAN